MRSRPVLAALLITAAFIGVRWRIYAAYPVDDQASWVERDAIMNGPRLVAIVATLAAMSAFGGLSRWKWRGLTSSCLLIAASSCGFVMKHGFFGAPQFPLSTLKVLWATVFVVLWEESCYRGLLYLGLRERFGPVPAALMSSAAFTVMHVQAQLFSSWPWIFLIGIAACASLEGGTGLLWLMLAYWLVDSLPFIFDGGQWWGWTTVLGSSLCFAGAALGLYRLHEQTQRAHAH